MNQGQTLASPNHIVWQLFEALRRICVRISECTEENDSEIRQDAAIAVILSVQCVEVFLNVYFRVVVSEAGFEHKADDIICDLSNPRFGLESKIRKWPQKVFGKELNFSQGAARQFVELKNKRNRLMHFTSSHQSIEVPGVEIHGMADVSEYTALNAKTAFNALSIAEEFLCEVFAMRGISTEHIPHALHSWTGRVPDSKSSHRMS